jgi:hypothetical protein
MNIYTSISSNKNISSQKGPWLMEHPKNTYCIVGSERHNCEDVIVCNRTATETKDELLTFF